MANSRLDKLHIYLCIIAAFTATVVCIVTHESLYRMCVWITLSIIVFYILGQIMRFYIVNKIFPKAEEETETGEGTIMDIEDMDDVEYMDGDAGEIAEFDGETADELMPDENFDLDNAGTL